MSKQWARLFTGNFVGVFNDNLLKNAIIFIAAGWSVPSWLSQSQLVALVSAALIVPYLIFSPLGGRWAVKFSKQGVFRIFKILEFPIMAIAAVAFVYELIYLALLAVLLMGIQSCLYSPSKYGLIRDIGGVEGSARGSGIFEAMAFLGILAGTVTAAWISDRYSVVMLLVLFFLLAFIGYIAVAGLKVKELPPEPDSSRTVHVNPVRFVLSSFRLASSLPGVNLAVIGISFFWMFGGILQMNIVVDATRVLEVSNTVTGIIMAMAALGIIAGNWMAGIAQQKFSKSLLIHSGSSGMTLGFALLAFFDFSTAGFAIVVMLIAVAGGFYQVPWLTVIQQSDAGRKAGQLLAYMNVVIFIFVLAGTLLFSLTALLTSDNSIAVFFVLLLLNCLIVAVNYRNRIEINTL